MFIYSTSFLGESLHNKYIHLQNEQSSVYKLYSSPTVHILLYDSPMVFITWKTQMIFSTQLCMYNWTSAQKCTLPIYLHLSEWSKYVQVMKMLTWHMCCTIKIHMKYIFVDFVEVILHYQKYNHHPPSLIMYTDKCICTNVYG